MADDMSGHIPNGRRNICRIRINHMMINNFLVNYAYEVEKK